ncbi:hypothetical protein AAG906_024792 [Vitis piasezkii]|uniref:Uncharacterized protein n=1 Tax=Vitis vinifera TaxID=29760 RepID=A0A438F646_VITVI|nr:hypothetical protein CK203_075231 [Vitis vinifera]
MNNAVRSGIVVVGAIAFGWLTLQVGFKPFLEKAQLQFPESQPPPDLHDAHTFPDSPSQEEFDTIQDKLGGDFVGMISS